MIAAVDKLLLLSNDKTKFIPGHGPICSIKELKEYRNLLFTIQDYVEAQVRENRILVDIIKDTKIKIQYENKGGDKFIEQVYRSVKRHLTNEKF